MGGCTDSSESTHVKMQHCRKSHVAVRRKSHVAVHMYVLQYMHEYTVSIDGTLISNLI